MAKLSLKGIVSLSHQIIKDGKTNTHNIELFQDDFEDCVMLTIEEAKVIEELALLCLFLRPKAVTIEKAKVMKELNNRIEQAEMSKQST